MADMDPSQNRVDSALVQLGSYGVWQWVVYTLWCVSTETSIVTNLIIVPVFLGGVPEHRCRIPENVTATRVGHCQLYFNVTNETTSCTYGWEYPDKEFGNTIVSEWDLVCERNFYAELTQTLFVVGTMVGSGLISPLSDKFGRKPVHLISHFFLAVISSSTAAVTSYPAFIAMRTLCGVLIPGIGLTGIIASCEVFPAGQRTFAGQFIYFWWVVALMILGGLAYAIREWRHLQLTVSLLPLVALSGYWLCPESIPWLVANNKIRKAEKIIHKAAKINKVSLPEHPFEITDDDLLKADANGADASTRDTPRGILDIDDDLGMQPLPSAALDFDKDDIGKSKQNGKAKIQKTIGGKHNKKVEDKQEFKGDNIIIALKHKVVLKNLMVLLALWFVNSLVYGGLALSSASLAGERFLNFFLQSLVELPAVFLCIYVLKRHGRRLPICIFHIITGISLGVIVFVPEKTELWPVVMVLSLIGRFASTFTFNSLIMYTLELFPTNARNSALGITSFAARVSGALAPFSTLLMRTISWLPGLLFGILSIVVGILTLLLPESVNRPLPETAGEIEVWQKEQRFCPCMKPKAAALEKSEESSDEETVHFSV
ncbi:organic cation transporter protein-like isoform X2 [Lineus longissimus]|uniref:organic cation transporter protein-like isoform X2 n=1 Tax=Lineus longissimus TaxID=88925 RepID=UPI00315C5316